MLWLCVCVLFVFSVVVVWSCGGVVVWLRDCVKKNPWKTPLCVDSKRLRVLIQNVLVCTSTHGDVLNRDTEAFRIYTRRVTASGKMLPGNHYGLFTGIRGLLPDPGYACRNELQKKNPVGNH